MRERVIDFFRSIYQTRPEHILRAPGRVNLIGEHTDYNQGYVLPMAIDRAVWIALRPRTDRRVQVHALDVGQSVTFDLDEPAHADMRWADYLRGVAWTLETNGCILRGWEGVLSGNLPRGAGLSSSAALEVATAHAFAVVSDLNFDFLRIARIAQHAENNWVGVKSGIMDQAVSAGAKAGHAFFLDCRSLEYQHIPLPREISVVVMDTSTRRGLADSAYNERRSQCDSAAQAFGVTSLRDVTMEMLQHDGGKLDEIILRRARHVVMENTRVLDAVRAMRTGDLDLLGRCFNESHRSLREDFLVTGEALDLMVEIAQAQPGCWGARMTGAGFGGCAVAVVERRQVQAFMAAVRDKYKRRSGMLPVLFTCEAVGGASLE